MNDDIGWGVDGFGNKYFICDYCALFFGKVDRYEIVHVCDRARPRDHNRGIIAGDEGRKL